MQSAAGPNGMLPGCSASTRAEAKATLASHLIGMADVAWFVAREVGLCGTGCAPWDCRSAQMGSMRSNA